MAKTAAAAAAKGKTTKKKKVVATKKKAAKHATPKKNKKNATAKQKQKKAAWWDDDGDGKSRQSRLGCMAWRRTVHSMNISSDNDNKKDKDVDRSAVVPYTLDDNEGNGKTARQRFWPSSLFFNAKYKRGILVDKSKNKKNNNYFVKSQGYTNDNDNDDDSDDSDSDSDDDDEGCRSRPCLTPVEAQMFGHKHAAHTAVSRRFPVEVGRLLGTITLEIEEKLAVATNSSSLLPPGLQKIVDKHNAKSITPRQPSARYQQVKKISPKQAMDQVNSDSLLLEQEGPATAISAASASASASNSKNNQKKPAAAATQQQQQSTKKARAQEIINQWKAVQDCRDPYQETWSPNDGRIPNVEQTQRKDKCCVPLLALSGWLAKGLEAGTLIDRRANQVCELYRGLTTIPVNASQILGSLVNLSDPTTSLYGIPLVVVYPRMVRTTVSSVKSASKGKKKSNSNTTTTTTTVWKVQMGVYMHRVLPEIFSCEMLHIVMSALDEGSYHTSQPIKLPPAGPEVFQSAPYPRVDMSVLDHKYDRDRDRDSSSSSSSSDDKDDDDKDDDDDEDMEGGSRDDMVVSPFSTKGLLKLLENKGCDVSEWPQIQQQLQGKFHLELLLHQVHAICWMIQMEHLEGPYGINSLLWEQRTFPDGGHYYYSPALGQIRLGAPPQHMKGGLLCDEQGLGKTVEVLGLIMATLPEMKGRAEKASESKKKASYNYDDDNYYSAQSSDDDENDEYIAHTTLIIVPPALVAQWIHEIEKAVGKDTLTVSMLVAQTGELKRCLPPPPVRDPSAGAENNDDDDDEEDDWDQIQASDIVVCTYDCLDKKACAKVLQNVQWGRVVLDEMQEIRSSTTQIAKNCENLQCGRRWMLSGTPIFGGIQDLSGELNFLKLEPFGANHNDGFYQFAVMTPWEEKHPHAIETLRTLGLVALRRSKDMTIAGTNTRLLDLKPLTVEFIPVPQSHSERALYCWMEYLVARELQHAAEVRRKKKDNDGNAYPGMNRRPDTKSRALCLRLLRETCITPLLLNGGVGTSSQLKAIHQLMVFHNRREEEARLTTGGRENGHMESAHKKRATSHVMSCTQALRFLTQHQEEAKTGDNFVTDVVTGPGTTSNRDRAAVSAEARFETARTELAEASAISAQAKTKRARARWQWALEMVCTGQYNDGRQHNYSGLWQWRRLVGAGMEHLEKSKAGRESSKVVAEILIRGWRPSEHFVNVELPKKLFHWAHPNALLAENIPKEVTQKELASAARDAAKLYPGAKLQKEKCTLKAGKVLESYENDKRFEFKKDDELMADLARLSKMVELLGDGDTNKGKKERKTLCSLEAELEGLAVELEEAKTHDKEMEMPKIVKVCERKNTKGFWRAIIKFEAAEDGTKALKTFGRSAGAPILSHRSIPHIEAMKQAASDEVSQLESELKLYFSDATKQLMIKAKKKLSSTSKGLRLVTRTTTLPSMEDEIREMAGTEHAHIIVTKAIGQQRSLAPRKASMLADATQTVIADASSIVFEKQAIIAKSDRVLSQLNRLANGKIPEQIQQLSAFGTLEALMDEQMEKTQCCICLGALGEEGEGEGAKITMLKCSHFYCTECIQHYCRESISAGRRLNCPSCRKEFSLAETILIDPQLKHDRDAIAQERAASKELVRDAAKMLEESNGHLDAYMWRALYLAFDVPDNVPNNGSHSFAAIPREVLTHLRAATGMPTHCQPRQNPLPGSVKGAGRCSKIERLLDDLPMDERSVIFSSNKDVIMHLQKVLADEGVGFQAIFSGQSTNELKNSVSNWELDGDKPSDPPPFLCLLVQAGAAASGLTLTAACKMFIMEPFLQHAAESQAYARCHRLTQTKPVSCKVYYAPVSVESRLLDWRRKGSKLPLIVSATTDEDPCKDTTIIVHDINEEGSENGSDLSDAAADDDEDEDEDKDGEESDDVSEGHQEDVVQANYLLGLHD